MSLNIKNVGHDAIEFFETVVNRLILKKDTNIVNLTRADNNPETDINQISSSSKFGLCISPQYDIAEYIYKRDIKQNTSPTEESGDNFEMLSKNYCVDTRSVNLNSNENVTKILENIVLDDSFCRENYKTKIQNNADQDIPYFEFLFPLKIIFKDQSASNLGPGPDSEKFLYNSFTKFPFLHFRIYRLKKIKMEIIAGNNINPASGGDINLTMDNFSEVNDENNLKYDCNLIFPSSTAPNEIPFTFYSQLISGCMAQTDDDKTLDGQRIVFEDFDVVNTANRKNKKRYSSAVINSQRVDYENNGWSFLFSINENKLTIENKKKENDVFKDKNFSFAVTNITSQPAQLTGGYSDRFLNVVRKNLTRVNFIRGYNYLMNEDLGKINFNIENTGVADDEITSIRDALNRITLAGADVSKRKTEITEIEKKNTNGKINWDFLRWFHYVYKNREVLKDDDDDATMVYKFEDKDSLLSDFFEQTNFSFINFLACFSRNTLGYYLINVNSMSKLYHAVYKDSVENGDYSQIYTLDLDELYNAILQDIISITVS